MKKSRVSTTEIRIRVDYFSFLYTLSDGGDGDGGIGDTGRFSLTFRDAPSVIGREHEFATFKVDEHFNKEDNFKWRSNETASNLIKNQKREGWKWEWKWGGG